jgi:hypothetical protein
MSGDVSPLFLNFSTSFKFRQLNKGKGPRKPPNRGLNKPQSQCGRGGGEKRPHHPSLSKSRYRLSQNVVFKLLNHHERSELNADKTCNERGLLEFQSVPRVRNSWIQTNASDFIYIYIYIQTPWPLVRERTIPTDRPPLVDEI